MGDEGSRDNCHKRARGGERERERERERASGIQAGAGDELEERYKQIETEGREILAAERAGLWVGG